MWKAHPDNASAAAWSDFRADLDAALDLAAVAGLRIGIEPESANVIHDARTARRLLDEVGSDRLGIVLDAANICAGQPASEHRDILVEAFDLLAGDIALAHAKDIDADGRVVPPGSGVIDLRLFVRKLAEAGYDRGLIGHGFDHADARLAAHRLGELCGGQP
jgi:sugar phosphate isomerase/epimerase